MGLRAAEDSESRFVAYVEGLTSVIGHADREGPLRDYCTGLVMPCERKSVEPMAAVTAPARVGGRRRRAHPNSMARKTSGSSCGRTGSQIGSSNPSTISSITAATLGTPSSIGLGKSCPSRAATGHPWVTQCEYWYNTSSVSWCSIQEDWYDVIMLLEEYQLANPLSSIQRPHFCLPDSQQADREQLISALEFDPRRRFDCGMGSRWRV
jgi:hypothetical protein